MNPLQKVWTVFKENKVFRCIVVIELILLAWVCLQTIRRPHNFVLGTDDFAYEAGEVTLTDDDGLRIADSETEEGDAVLTSSTFSFPAGAYNVTIYYQTDLAKGETANSQNIVGTVDLKTDGIINSLQWEAVNLREDLSEISQRIYVGVAYYKVPNCRFNFYYSGSDPLTVYQVSVTEILSYRILRLLATLLVFVFLDGLFIYFFEGERKYKLEVAGILGIVALSGLLLMADFFIYGDDIYIHLNRIVSLAQEIRAGNFYPAIYTNAVNDYGYAFPLFYPQLFLYLPALLYLAGASLLNSYQIYVFVINILTCLLTFYCCKKMFHDSKAALLGSALYTLCAYRLVNVFVRAAVGEYTAMCFFPCVIYGIYCIYTAPKDKKIPFSQYIFLVLGMTGILESHMLSLEMTGIFLLIFCICMIRRTVQPKRLFALIKSVLLTLLLNVFYLLPFALSMFMDISVNHITYSLDLKRVYLMQIFGLFYPGATLESAGIGTYNRMPLPLGLSLTVGLILFVMCYAWRKEISDNPAYKIGACTFLLGILAIIFVVFPWYSINTFSAAVYHIFAKIQFPWRYLSIASVLCTFCTVAAIATLQSKSQTLAKWATVIVLSALVLNTGLFLMEQMQNGGSFHVVSNEYTYNANIGEGEYLLYGTDKEQMYERNLIFDEEELLVMNYDYSSGVSLVTCQNVGAEETLIELPLQNYDNYHAYDTATDTEFTIVNGSNNRLTVVIPADYNGTFTVRYQVPVLWKISYAVSGISAVLVILYWVLQAYRIPNKLRERRASA